MAFTFDERIWTVGLNVEGFTNRNGTRPNNDDLVDFLKKDVDADLKDLLHIQWNDILNVRTVFMRFGNEEAATAFEGKVAGESAVKGGIPWTACNKRRLGGWRCDGTTLVVKIMYVSYEVPLIEVRKELERFGIVKDIDYSYMKIPGYDHRIQDGVIMARITLKPGVKELPCWIRRPRKEGMPAEVWRWQHRGQQQPGCWNCGDLYHIGKRCRVPLLGIQEDQTPRRPDNRRSGGRNATFSQALRNVKPPAPLQDTDSDSQSSVEGDSNGVTTAVVTATITNPVLKALVQGASPEVQVDKVQVPEVAKEVARVEQQQETPQSEVQEVVLNDTQDEDMDTDQDMIPQWVERQDSFGEIKLGQEGAGEVLEGLQGGGEVVDRPWRFEEDVLGVGRQEAVVEVEVKEAKLPEGTEGKEEGDVPGDQEVMVQDTGGGVRVNDPGDTSGVTGEVGGAGGTGPGGTKGVTEDIGGATDGTGQGDTSGGTDDPGGGTGHSVGQEEVIPSQPMEIVRMETVDHADLPVSQDAVTALGVEAAAAVNAAIVSGAVTADSRYTVFQVLEDGQLSAATVLSGSEIGGSLPCGQGTAGTQAGGLVGEDKELVYLGGMEVLDKNLRDLTQSPNIFTSQDIKQEERMDESGEKVVGSGYTLSGGLPLGQGSGRVGGVKRNAPTPDPPLVEITSSSSDVESGEEGRGVERKNKSQGVKKSQKLQDGDSK